MTDTSGFGWGRKALRRVATAVAIKGDYIENLTNGD